MPDHAGLYLERLTNIALERVALELDPRHAAQRASVALAFHFNDPTSRKFQDYYALTVANRDLFLNSPAFFETFKKRYSLQGINRAYLTGLEENKTSLLRYVDGDDLTGLYFAYFADAALQYRGQRVRRNLGSFFAKFVHTFRPAEYCALDNPIKDFLGLRKESFFLAFLAVSASYRMWSARNPGTLSKFRAAMTRGNVVNQGVPTMTDLKLLDLIFWQRANKPQASND